ncbi:MAG: hypothetical protein IJ867_06795 [Clostridia bacterium]|nr:hypothetical protein [Clostridia bacterium]
MSIEVISFECRWNNGVPDKSRGKLVWLNKNKYEGELLNQKPNGRGKFTWADGDYYDGEFKDGKFEGSGVLFYHDKKGKMTEYKKGEWKNGYIYNGERYAVGENGKQDKKIATYVRGNEKKKLF